MSEPGLPDDLCEQVAEAIEAEWTRPEHGCGGDPNVCRSGCPVPLYQLHGFEGLRDSAVDAVLAVPALATLTADLAQARAERDEAEATANMRLGMLFAAREMLLAARERAEAAESKVARVEALVGSTQDVHRVTLVEKCAAEIRAALTAERDRTRDIVVEATLETYEPEQFESVVQQVHEYARRAQAAEQREKALREAVAGVLLDWPHDDECPRQVLDSICQCWQADLRALLAADQPQAES